MTTIIILAGGKSSRMGQDKAMMNGGANRLVKICNSISDFRVITLCGKESRISLFEGEVWPDPIEFNGVFEIIKWCISKVVDDILMIPCDAFKLQKDGISYLLKTENGIPVDEENIRQPLIARITDRNLLNVEASTINGFFADLPTIRNSNFSKQYLNFNTAKDLQNL